MKLFFILIIITLLLQFGTIYGQHFQSDGYDGTKTDKYIKEIDQQMNVVADSIEHFKKEKYNVTCDYWWGTITFYHDGKNLRCISDEGGGEHGTMVTMYYFWNDKLYYVKRTWDYYLPTWGNPDAGQPTFINQYEERYLYFYQETPLYCCIKRIENEEGSEIMKFENAVPEIIDCETQTLLEDIQNLRDCYAIGNFDLCVCE